MAELDGLTATLMSLHRSLRVSTAHRRCANSTRASAASRAVGQLQAGRCVKRDAGRIWWAALHMGGLASTAAKAGPARQGSSFGGRLSATSPARSNLLLDASAEGSQGGSAGRQVDQQRPARESRVQARAHASGCSTQRTLRLERAYGKALILQQLATHPLCAASDATHRGRQVSGGVEEGKQAGFHKNVHKGGRRCMGC